MNIVKDMAVTASLAFAMVGQTSIDLFRHDRERLEYELWILNGERKENPKTTEISKYLLLNPLEAVAVGVKDAKHMKFVQEFARHQVDLEEDFLAALNRLEEKTRNAAPRRVNF
jgi:hypothetical protein